LAHSVEPVQGEVAPGKHEAPPELLLLLVVVELLPLVVVELLLLVVLELLLLATELLLLAVELLLAITVPPLLLVVLAPPAPPAPLVLLLVVLAPPAPPAPPVLLLVKLAPPIPPVPLVLLLVKLAPPVLLPVLPAVELSEDEPELPAVVAPFEEQPIVIATSQGRAGASLERGRRSPRPPRDGLTSPPSRSCRRHCSSSRRRWRPPRP
jgi:hypothetical protein